MLFIILRLNKKNEKERSQFYVKKKKINNQFLHSFNILNSDQFKFKSQNLNNLALRPRFDHSFIITVCAHILYGELL